MNPHLIYEGKIRHRRFSPVQHTFDYRLFMFCFDINLIDTVFKPIPHVSIEKFNWFTYKRKNYLPSPDLSLDQMVRFLIEKKHGILPRGKIFLLTHLACLGYCFNPISIFFVLNESNDEIDFLVIEVTNTPWLERCTYILSNPVKPRKSIYEYHFEKKLHVSPFMSMDYTYQFKLKFEDNNIIVHMCNFQNETLHFDATLSLEPVPLLKKSPRRVFIKYPLITYKVTSAIYWQALKLWLKGNKFYSHPT